MPKCRTRAAIAVSAIFHAALLLFFVHFVQDAAQIAGGERSGVVMLGNADQDQLRSGEMSEPNVTHVSLISASKARPVEMARVAPAAAVEALEPATAAEAVQPSQVITPVEEAVAEPETTATVAQAAIPDAILAAPSPHDVPPVLATDESTAVAVPEPTPANMATEVAKPADPARADPSKLAAEAQPVEEPRSEQPVETAETPSLPQRIAEIPAPAKREKPAEKHRRDALAKAAKHVEPGAKAPSGGSHGKGNADQHKGRSNGAENGQQAAASRPAKASSEGNAAVSNYPGKIVRKLRRALRYPRDAGSRRLRGVAEVRFVVSSGGNVGGIQLVVSSGSPILDQAALEAVKRAAPFPPIPAEAGRSNWPFTVPLAFAR
ncbi:MAG TPA: TonB family protein [Rhizobiaceae bacterium]|nr:TonB family protein [Rhizobiaceae bacterium]